MPQKLYNVDARSKGDRIDVRRLILRIFGPCMPNRSRRHTRRLILSVFELGFVVPVLGFVVSVLGFVVSVLGFVRVCAR